MSRVRSATALAAVVSTAFVGTALASATKVTGGTATVTPSSAAAALLSSNGITITPVAPATAASGVFTFPIGGGHLNAKLHGTLRLKGGFKLANSAATVGVSRMRIVSDKAGVSLWALVRHPSSRPCARAHRRARIRCRILSHFDVARIGRVTNTTVSGTTATGTVHITAFTATLINKLAGKHVVSAGAVLGTASITVPS
jgi:hypothetical protein